MIPLFFIVFLSSFFSMLAYQAYIEREHEHDLCAAYQAGRD